MTHSGFFHFRFATHVGAWLAVGLLATSPPAGAQPNSIPTESFGVAASDQTLWVFQQRLEGQPQVRTLRLVFTTADAADDTPFRRPSRVQAVNGEVGAAAVLGDRLFIIFTDGTHRSYDPLNLRVERKLPRNCVPLALAGDHTGQALYALVPSSIAAELPGSELSPADQPDSPTSAPTTAPVLPDTEYYLVRYSRGRWQRDRPAPDFLDHPTGCLLAAHDGQCHLIVASDPADADARYSHSQTDAWIAPIRLNGLSYRQILTCGIFHDRFGILAQSPDDLHPRLSWIERDRFELGPTLDDAASASAAAWFGSHLALTFLDADSEISLGTWPMQGGPADTSPTRIDVLQPRHLSWIAEHMPILAYGGLAMIMLIVFTRRRDSLLTLATLQPGHILAPFGRRLLGFLLDVTLFSPVALYILWPAIEVFLAQQKLDPGIDRITLYREMPGEFFLRWLVAIGLFALYGSVFEGFFGATPGKRIVRCKVVDEQGRPPRRWAILLRNAMRLIEMFPPFDLMPAAVLVILTRNRQRLGDLLARTVVVQIVPLPPDSQSDDESTDPDPDPDPDPDD